MVEDLNVEKIVKDMKKNCLLCVSYKGFRPEKSDGAMQVVRANLETLVDYYNLKYDEFRSHDASADKILKTKDNKILCLDALQTCRGCNKEFDKVNRIFRDQ